MQRNKGPCANPALWSWVLRWKERGSGDSTLVVGIFAVH